MLARVTTRVSLSAATRTRMKNFKELSGARRRRGLFRLRALIPSSVSRSFREREHRGIVLSRGSSLSLFSCLSPFPAGSKDERFRLRAEHYAWLYGTSTRLAVGREDTPPPSPLPSVVPNSPKPRVMEAHACFPSSHESLMTSRGRKEAGREGSGPVLAIPRHQPRGKWDRWSSWSVGVIEGAEGALGITRPLTSNR